MTKKWWLVLLTVLFFVPKSVLGENDSLADKEPVVEEVESGPLQLTLSIVPGVLVHGSGQLIAGDTKLGLRLLAAQGIGILGLAGGVAMLAITGASDKFNVPVIWTMSLGGAAFMFSWLGDVYASSGASRWTGRPRSLPLILFKNIDKFSLQKMVGYRFYLSATRSR